VPEVLENRSSGTEKFESHRERCPSALRPADGAMGAGSSPAHRSARLNRILLPVAGFFDRLRDRTVTN
jgi:hypothetical protein